ncbi:MAG: hypothetical protein QW838_07675, partial [Candidatus Nitrosotenuis sp.]
MDKKVFVAIGVAIAVAMAILVLIPTTIEPPKPIEILKNQKLGLVINTPAPQVTLDQLKEVYHEASLTGTGRTNLYLFWNHIEPQQDQYNWKDTDIL